MPELTRDQMQDKFVEAVVDITQMWGNQIGIAPQAAAEGTAFSILNLLDGNADLPPMLVIPTDPNFDAEVDGDEGDAVEVWTDEALNGPDVELHSLFTDRIAQRVAAQINTEVDDPESTDEE